MYDTKTLKAQLLLDEIDNFPQLTSSPFITFHSYYWNNVSSFMEILEGD